MDNKEELKYFSKYSLKKIRKYIINITIKTIVSCNNQYINGLFLNLKLSNLIIHF